MMESAADRTAVPIRPPSADPQPPQSDSDSAATVLSGAAAAPPPTSISEIGSLLRGRQLGDYRLDEFVGGGGMGAVFKALDTTLDRTVAVKVLAGQQSADEEMLRRFRNEAQSAARLNHENIGLVHAVGVHDDWHFIVFEYIEGTNLRDLVRQQGPLSVATTVDLALQITAALDHAHRRNVTHRDIKPSNIIITPAGRAKLVDMGLARLQQVAGEQDLTVSGMTLGTFDYISPEQARDARAADIRSDLYSLGCTMFFMLIGRAPFAEGTMVQKLLQHQQEPPPAVESLRTDIPRRLAGVIRRLMAKQPEDRFEQPLQLEAELVAIADDEGIDLTVSRPPVEAERASRRPAAAVLWPWAVAALCLSGIVAVLAATASRPEPPPDDADGPVLMLSRPEASKRVVSEPAREGDFADLEAAVAAAVDGDVIALAADREHLVGPTALRGRRLTLRAAGGRRPLLRIANSLFPASAEPQAAWQIVAAELTIEGIDIRIDDRQDPTAGPRSCFRLEDGGRLVCRDVGFATSGVAAAPAAVARDGADSILTVAGQSARTIEPEQAAVEGVAAGAEQPPMATVEMVDVAVNGAVTWCRVEGDAGLEVRWRGGGVTTTSRFLDVTGNASSSAAGAAVSLDLAGATFACQEGFARLADSPMQARVARLVASVNRCRFLLPDPAAFIEQVGVAEPEAYQTAIVWRDRLGRYEGSRIFRRIDGAGDPVEIDFAAAPRPLVHQPFFDGWPAEPSQPE